MTLPELHEGYLGPVTLWLKDDGAVVDGLDTVDSITATVELPSGATVAPAVVITDAATGEATMTAVATTFPAFGEYRIQVTLVWPDRTVPGKVTQFPVKPNLA